jgi:glycoside/pentoside/hexuronide:cation symporter, GPH family
MKPRLTALMAYGVLALPLAFAGLPVFVHAPDYYAVQWGVSLSAIGFILVIMRLIDAIQDPLIGQLSDHWHKLRREIVVLGIILTGAGFWMLFNPFGDPLMWMALSLLVCTTGFSIVTINLQAMGGLWQVAPEARLKVSSAREAFGLIGLLIGTVLPSILVMLMAPKAAFSSLSLIFLPVLAIGGIVFYFWARQAKLGCPVEGDYIAFSALFKDRWLQKFSAIYGISSLASAMPAVLIVFYVRDYLKAEAYLGLYLIIYFLSGALAMPIWQALVKRGTAIKVWGMAMILSVITFVWAYFLPEGALVAFGIVCFLSGTAFGADMVLPPTIVAERINAKAHEGAASRYYALLAFLSKAALALATGLTLPVLDVLGYKPATDSGVWALPFIYALVPCVIKVISVIGLWRAGLNEPNPQALKT